LSRPAPKGAAVRAASARSLASVIAGATLDSALAGQISMLTERDRPLARELCAGTLRHFQRLDAVLVELLDRPLRRRDSEVRALALIGLYQLAELRVPAHAAVSATVDAASVLGHHRAKGLLNALLRRFQREGEAIVGSLDDAARAAHPQWLWSAIGAHWPTQRETIVQANNSRPPMTLRVNAARGDRDAYLATLRSAGIEATAGNLSPEAVTLAQAMDVADLPGFADGACSVQDEAAQLAARALAPSPGERILDACAAPGGKACHLLELEPSLSLTAMDISAERLQRVAASLERLGLAATLIAGDAGTPPQTLAAGGFDAILADVPCSATGVIRRHPDIKLLRRSTDIPEFAAQQLAILRGLWPLLAPGGRLLYVTCSILPAENSDVVAAFLDEHPDAGEATPDLPGAERCPHGVQLLPATGGCDGLYFALITRAAGGER
jgi:16S rRNA (cytosine967-C5)-methyltransferase